MDFDIYDITGNYLIVISIAIVAIGILFFIIAFPANKHNDLSLDYNDEVEEKRDINKAKKSKSKVKESLISNGPQSKTSAVKQITKISGQPVLKKPAVAVELQPQKNKNKKTKENEETKPKKDIEEIEEWEMATSRRGKKNKPKKDGEEEDVEEVTPIAVDISAYQNKVIQLADQPILKIETVIANNEKISKKKKIKEVAVQEIVTRLADSNITNGDCTIPTVATTDSNGCVDGGTLIDRKQHSIVEQIGAVENLNEEAEGDEEEEFSVIEGAGKTKNKKKKKKTPESRSKYQELPVTRELVTNEYHESANVELDSKNLQKLNEILDVSKPHPNNKKQTKNNEKSMQKNTVPETIICSENMLPVTPQLDNFTQSLQQQLQKVKTNLPAIENTGKAPMENLLTNGLPSVEEIGDWQAAKATKKKKVPTATLR